MPPRVWDRNDKISGYGLKVSPFPHPRHDWLNDSCARCKKNKTKTGPACKFGMSARVTPTHLPIRAFMADGDQRNACSALPRGRRWCYTERERHKKLRIA